MLLHLCFSLFSDFPRYVESILPKNCVSLYAENPGMIGSVEYNFQGPHLPQPADLAPDSSFCTSHQSYQRLKLEDKKSVTRSSYYPLLNSSTDLWVSSDSFYEMFAEKYPRVDTKSVLLKHFSFCPSQLFGNISVIKKVFRPDLFFGEGWPKSVGNLWFYQLMDPRFLTRRTYFQKVKMVEEKYQQCEMLDPGPATNSQNKQTADHVYCTSAKKFLPTSKRAKISHYSDATGDNSLKNVTLDSSAVTKDSSECSCSRIDTSKSTRSRDFTSNVCASSKESDVNCMYPNIKPRHNVSYSTASLEYMFSDHRSAICGTCVAFILNYATVILICSTFILTCASLIKRIINPVILKFETTFI